MEMKETNAFYKYWFIIIIVWGSYITLGTLLIDYLHLLNLKWFSLTFIPLLALVKWYLLNKFWRKT